MESLNFTSILMQAQAQAEFFHMLPVPLESTGGAFLANTPLPLPTYSPPVMYLFPGPGFGQQALYPEALPTPYTLQVFSFFVS